MKSDRRIHTCHICLLIINDYKTPKNWTLFLVNVRSETMKIVQIGPVSSQCGKVCTLTQTPPCVRKHSPLPTLTATTLLLLLLLKASRAVFTLSHQGTRAKKLPICGSMHTLERGEVCEERSQSPISACLHHPDHVSPQLTSWESGAPLGTVGAQSRAAHSADVRRH